MNTRRPFDTLARRRQIRKPLPSDLADFDAEFEGIGLEQPAEFEGVRLCRLNEVKRVSYADILVLERDLPAWEQFEGFRVGISPYADDVVYVRSAPVCAAGAIMVLGPDISGPAGDGPARHQPTLVVARTLAQWLKHLEECDWMEYGFYPGSILNMPRASKKKLKDYYKNLNPHISWGQRRIQFDYLWRPVAPAVGSRANCTEGKNRRRFLEFAFHFPSPPVI